MVPASRCGTRAAKPSPYHSRRPCSQYGAPYLPGRGGIPLVRHQQRPEPIRWLQFPQLSTGGGHRRPAHPGGEGGCRAPDPDQYDTGRVLLSGQGDGACSGCAEERGGCRQHHACRPADAQRPPAVGNQGRKGQPVAGVPRWFPAVRLDRGGEGIRAPSGHQRPDFVREQLHLPHLLHPSWSDCHCDHGQWPVLLRPAGRTSGASCL